MVFEYDLQKVFTQAIDVVDIGNTALRCTTVDGDEYYIILKTVLGKTSILKFGPVAPDIPMLLTGYTLSYKKINYKENLIEKEITQLINDPKKGINNIEEIIEPIAFSALPDVQNLFNEDNL